MRDAAHRSSLDLVPNPVSDTPIEVGRAPRALAARAARAALAGLCVALALAGCSSWFTKHDPRYDPAPLTQYPAGMSVQAVWTQSVGNGAGLGFVPAVVNGAVYAAAPNGTVGKYDLASGRPIWRIEAGAKLSAGVGSDGTTTVVVSHEGQILAYDDGGKVKWKAQASSDVEIPPVVGGGVVAVRSGDYRIQAFDANNGERMWSVQRPGPALALRAPTQMRIEQGLVITGLPGGKMMAIDANTGNVQWEGTVAVPKGGSDLERLTDVVGTPRVIGPLLCAVAYQGRITCFDVSQGGRPTWAKDYSSSSGLVLDEANAYSPDQSSVVTAFSLGDGRVVWKQDALRNRGLNEPAVLGQAVAVGDYEGYVHFLSRTDGHLLARLSVGGGPVISPLVGSPQGVLVQTGNGNLMLIGTQ
jgi:outer membrane protein assembly factor BamB